MELYEKLKLLRKLNGYTQQDIAEKFYISRQAVQKWECSETTPDISKLHDLSTTYGLSVDDLLNNQLDENTIKKLLLRPDYDLGQEDLAILRILRTPSRIDFVILGIIVFSTSFVLILLHLLGIVFVLISFFSFLSLLISSIYFSINIFFNIHNDFSVLLVNIGFTFVSFSSSHMVYLFFVWMLSTYTKLVKTVSSRFKEYNILKALVINEK